MGIVKAANELGYLDTIESVSTVVAIHDHGGHLRINSKFERFSRSHVDRSILENASKRVALKLLRTWLDSCVRRFNGFRFLAVWSDIVGGDRQVIVVGPLVFGSPSPIGFAVARRVFTAN